MKTYDFLMTLSGTNAPTCRVLKNEIGDGAWILQTVDVTP